MLATLSDPKGGRRFIAQKSSLRPLELRNTSPAIFFLPLNYTLYYFFDGDVYFLEVQLIYNVVLVSGIQQNDLVIHTYFYILFHSFSIMVYCRVLNIVSCAIQWDLVVHPLYI